MRSDSDLHETRTDGEQSETAPDFRVSFESRKKCGEFSVEDLRVCADALDWVGDTVPTRKPAQPIWPSGRMVYFLGGADGFVKIGYTSNLTSRVCDIQTANPQPLRLLAYVPSRGRLTEREYHLRFAAHRLHGEWFKRVPEIEAEIERLRQQPKPPEDDPEPPKDDEDEYGPDREEADDR